MKLTQALKEGKIALTEYEKIALNAIHDQGSFYEESLSFNGEFNGSAFLGYELKKEDVNNQFDPSGVIGSLSKKGILDVGDPIGYGEDIGYWINYELEFDKNEKIIFDLVEDTKPSLEDIIKKEKEHRHEDGMFGIIECKKSIKRRLESEYEKVTLFQLLEEYYNRACNETLFNRAMILACWELINEKAGAR